MLPTLDKVVSRIDSFLEPEQVRLVKRAYYFAEQAHDGQFRRSGEPYVTHPLAVAEILSDMRMDHQSLIAALLHDVIEDTTVTKAAIEAQFGQERFIGINIKICDTGCGISSSIYPYKRLEHR